MSQAIMAPPGPRQNVEKFRLQCRPHPHAVPNSGTMPSPVCRSRCPPGFVEKAGEGGGAGLWLATGLLTPTHGLVSSLPARNSQDGPNVPGESGAP